MTGTGSLDVGWWDCDRQSVRERCCGLDCDIWSKYMLRSMSCVIYGMGAGYVKI